MKRLVLDGIQVLKEAKKILATHKPMPLPEGAAEEMARIIESAEE